MKEIMNWIRSMWRMKIRWMTEERKKSKIIRIAIKIKLKIMKEKRHYVCKRIKNNHKRKKSDKNIKEWMEDIKRNQ